VEPAGPRQQRLIVPGGALPKRFPIIPKRTGAQQQPGGRCAQIPHRLPDLGDLSAAPREEELSLCVARTEAIRLAKHILELDEQLMNNEKQLDELVRVSEAASLLKEKGFKAISAARCLSASEIFNHTHAHYLVKTKTPRTIAPVMKPIIPSTFPAVALTPWASAFRALMNAKAPRGIPRRNKLMTPKMIEVFRCCTPSNLSCVSRLVGTAIILSKI
jgi:hypothetical protein